jgi:hypothetical protein
MKTIILGACALLLLAVCGLSGCAAMNKAAGMGVVSETKSDFDGTVTISATPSFLATKSWGPGVKLGALWVSDHPDTVALWLKNDSDVNAGAYLNITGLDINIDGEISSWPVGSTHYDNSGYNTVSKTIYTSSENQAVVPYSLLQRMVSAKDCRIRIHTTKGYEEAFFSTPSVAGSPTAVVSIREMMAKVAARR